MIGRERQRDVLREAVAQVVHGGSAFVVAVGEPGIGKTTLLNALADLAGEAGLAVGRGHAVADGGGPLWLWTSAMADVRGRRCGTSPDRGADALDLDGASGRFALFERFAADLSRCADDGPVVVVLDDLHWADVSALRLLRHLLDRPSMAGVLVAGGLRTTERLPDDVSEVLGGLLAHPAMELIEMPAFDAGETAAFAAERMTRRPSDDEVTVLAARSGGNPFFLGELLRWMPAGRSAEELDAALPLAVRESVRRRVVVEDAATQEVVRAAAVAGTSVSLDLLVRITDLDRADAGRSLDSAERAGLLIVAPDRPGSVSFAHDLVRQAVLSLLPTWDRVALHHRVGLALRDDVRSSSWATVVAHLIAARPAVDHAVLVDAAEEAAEEARRAGAYDEAARHLALALELTDAAGDTAERGELLLARGRMLWSAERADESLAVLGDAIGLARRTGDGALLARTALSWRGGDRRVVLGRLDDHYVALLREALSACPPGDGRLRCMLLARLALGAYSDLGDRDGADACDEAVAMARRLDDPEALDVALGTRFYYCWRPELLRERLAVAEEALALAVAADHAALVAQASQLRILALLESGRLGEAWNELDRFDTAATTSGQPMLQVRAMWLRATRHLVSGARAQADEAADEARRSAERMGRPDAAVERIGLSLMLGAAEDRVDDVIRESAPALRHAATYHTFVAIANGFGGRPVEAELSLGAVVAAGLERHPREMMWMFGRCGLLAAAVVAGDRATGAILYAALTPFADQWVILNPGIVVAGAVEHYLGLGAALLGHTDDAVTHLRRAVVAHERQSAVALALLSMHELAAVLARRDAVGDDAEVARIERRIALLADRNTVPFKPLLPIMWSAAEPSVRPPEQRLVLEGDTWLVEFAGARARLRDQRGMHHLRTLLERPGVEIPASTLAGAQHGLAGSSEATILDQRAMSEYRRRIADLHEDIDEATANHDIERAAMAEAELDALVEQLASATGMGGRARRFVGVDERARVSVTKAIRSAITHVALQLPDLGRHLTATVHTGGRCVYQPDPLVPRRWMTEQL